MPWREVIFTDAGAVYPAHWDMNPLHSRGNSATPPQGIETQDLFSSCKAAPESPAAPSFPQTEERAALLVETSP